MIQPIVQRVRDWLTPRWVKDLQRAAVANERELKYLRNHCEYLSGRVAFYESQARRARAQVPYMDLVGIDSILRPQERHGISCDCDFRQPGGPLEFYE